ncbi:MAG: SpoIIE family protein phosphatase [Verrucomicrobia bacterium]|nr:SpoIIE family protein phosphatase [Verrucomicrobiota bacterium]
MKTNSLSLRVCESSAAGEARRIAIGWAETLGFSAIKAGEVGIIVTELANNLWRHAGRGQVVLRALTHPGKTPAAPPIRGLEILSLDNGPGMADLERCSKDGYSTGGSTGIGLGAVARLSSYSEVYSRHKEGTVSLSQVWANPLPKTFFPSPMLGAVCVPVKEERVSGDSWAQRFNQTSQQILLVDGLGHGIRAAEAANEAVQIFLQRDLTATEMMNALHVALKSTVGAVVGLVEITLPGRVFSFTGVGNLEGKVINGNEKRSLLSHNGTVGHAMRTVRQWAYTWSQNSLLILHSDGISNKWDLENYPGLSSRHPSIIAGVIYRDFRRERDDASIIVMREPADRFVRE